MNDTTLFTEELATFLGSLFLAADGEGAVHAVSFAGTRTLADFEGELERSPSRPRVARSPRDGPCQRARGQLEEYFARERRTFDLPLRPAGTPFQRAVWTALGTIPYGETISYAELARRAGAPHAARAVGQANHHNPLPILVPCHRVIGSDGRLVGFAGGLAAKRALLDLERGQGDLGELLGESSPG